MTLARIADRLDRPGLLLFLPAAMLLALMLGGEVAMIPLSLGTLAAVAAMRRGRGTAVPVSDQVARALDLALAEGAASGASTGCFVILATTYPKRIMPKNGRTSPMMSAMSRSLLPLSSENDIPTSRFAREWETFAGTRWRRC